MSLLVYILYISDLARSTFDYEFIFEHYLSKEFECMYIILKVLPTSVHDMIIVLFTPFVVPTTSGLSLILHHVQIVGQLVTLECSVATVRGITSTVEFLWSTGGVLIKRVKKLSRDFTAHHLDIYTNTYTILPLSVSDDGRTYQCEVIISSRSPVIVTGNVTLDVTGKRFILKNLYIYMHYTFQFLLLQSV